MSQTTARINQVLHVTPGRLRVRLSREATQTLTEVEAGLKRVSGVTAVRPNSLTGNVLVLFDPGRVDAQQILSQLAAIEETIAAAPPVSLSLSAARSSSPASQPSPSVPSSLLSASAVRVGGVAVCAGLLAASHLVGEKKVARTATRKLAGLAAGMDLLADSPLLGNKIADLVGQDRANYLFSAVSILTNIFAANPVRLVVACIEAVLLLLALLARSQPADRQERTSPGDLCAA
jgi:hypothetical protein